MKIKTINVNNVSKITETSSTQKQVINDYKNWNKFFYNLGFTGDQVKEINFLNGQSYSFFNYGNGFLE